MKTKILPVCAFTFFVINANSQTLVTQQTHTNNSITGTNPLHKSLQVTKPLLQTALDANSNTYEIFFYSNQLPENISKISVQYCIITDDENNQYTGVLQSDNELSSTSTQKFVYSFSKDDFSKIVSAQNIIEMKLTPADEKSSGIVINKELQNEIIKQAKLLTSTTNENSNTQ